MSTSGKCGWSYSILYDDSDGDNGATADNGGNGDAADDGDSEWRSCDNGDNGDISDNGDGVSGDVTDDCESDSQ